MPPSASCSPSLHLQLPFVSLHFSLLNGFSIGSWRSMPPLYRCRIQVVMRLQIAEVMDCVQAVRAKRSWFRCAFSLPRCASAVVSLHPLGNLSLGVRAQLRRSMPPQFVVDKERVMPQCITPRWSPPLFGPVYYLRKVFFVETRFCKKSTVFFPAPHFTLPSGSV